MWFKILVACVPAAVVGILFEDELDRLFYNYWTEAFALIVFGVLFIIIEHQNKDVVPKVTALHRSLIRWGFLIGAFQLIAAVFPGNVQIRSDHSGSHYDRYFQNCGSRVYLFPGSAGYAGGKSAEDLKFGLVFLPVKVVLLLVGMGRLLWIYRGDQIACSGQHPQTALPRLDGTA